MPQVSIRNSVQLAVDQANERQAVKGWRFEVEALDDSSDPATGEAAARRLAEDPDVIGVVGTYNSGVAAEVSPVLGEAGIAMLSPANTDPALTVSADPANPVRPEEGYFRLVASDRVQGPFLAQSAYDDLGARRVAVVSETKPVSKGLADAFVSDFQSRGGTVVFNQVVPDGTTAYQEVATAISAQQPDLVFFGGEYESAAEFSKQASEAGVTVPVMGGDGIKDDAYITEAGEASNDDLASTVGAPLASLPPAASFAEAYEVAGFEDPASDFGVYAYDAANVLIAAAKGPLEGADQVDEEGRADVMANIQGTDMDGASGPVAFDQFGDTRTQVFSLYRVTDGMWTPIKTATVP